MKQMIYKPNRETEILDEGTYKGIHFLIVSYGTHPCAYIEIPNDHWLYNVDYSDASDFPIHGGLTWSGPLPNSLPNKPGFYYGWDYAHCGDYVGYEENFSPSIRTGGTKYTAEEILVDVYKAIDFLNEVR